MKLRMLSVIGDSASNYTEPIINDSSIIFFQEFENKLYQRNDWDYLVLPYMRQSSISFKEITIGYLNPSNKKYLTQSSITFYTDLKIRQSRNDKIILSKKLRYYLRKGNDIANSFGGLKAVVVKDVNEVNDLFIEFVKMSKKSLDVRNKRSAFEQEQQVGFFKDLIAEFNLNGYLLAVKLMFGEKIVAISFSYKYNKSIHYIIPTFDPNFADASPGHLMINEIINFGAKQGYEKFDFSPGDEKSYKARWADQTELIFKLEILNKSIGGKLYKILHYSIHTKLVHQFRLLKSQLYRELKNKNIIK